MKNLYLSLAIVWIYIIGWYGLLIKSMLMLPGIVKLVAAILTSGPVVNVHPRFSLVLGIVFPLVAVSFSLDKLFRTNHEINLTQLKKGGLTILGGVRYKPFVYVTDTKLWVRGVLKEYVVMILLTVAEELLFRLLFWKTYLWIEHSHWLFGLALLINCALYSAYGLWIKWGPPQNKWAVGLRWIFTGFLLSVTYFYWGILGSLTVILLVNTASIFSIFLSVMTDKYRGWLS